MTDEKELDGLIKRICEEKFGKVSRKMSDDGRWTEYIHVYGVPGIGPGAMAPIAAAEAMREALAK